MIEWRGVLAAVALAAQPALADLAELKQKGILRVVVARDEQPEILSLEPGRERGFEREVVEQFAALQKLQVEYHVTASYADRIPALLKGSGDMIVGIIDSPERRQHIEFTRELLPMRHVVVTRRPTPPVGSVEQYRRQRVGVLKDTIMAARTARAGVPEANVRVFATLDELLAALRKGEVTATALTLLRLRPDQEAHPRPGERHGAGRSRPPGLGGPQGGPRAAVGSRRLSRGPTPEPVVEPPGREVLRRGRARVAGTTGSASPGAGRSGEVSRSSVREVVAMCRNIRPLFNFEPPATDDEIQAASLQFVRKISGFHAPSHANQAAFQRSVEEVARVARRLVDSLVTSAPPRDRVVEAAKAKARTAQRFGRPVPRGSRG